MYFFSIFKKLFFVVFIVFIVNLNFEEVNGKQAESKYYEDMFEINVPALPTIYDNLFSNLEYVKIEIKGKKLIINGLAPDQVYNGIKINFNDNLERKYELELNNVITLPPVKLNNKFVYDVYKNGLGRKPDHVGFNYWKDNLENFNITSVDFITEIINSEEFNSIYQSEYQKIDALYKIIVGREADIEGFLYWIYEFFKLVNEVKLDNKQALNELVKKMIVSDEFKSIVEGSGFLYMK